MQKSNFGLIGKNIEYSFSRAYFKHKFETENINASYKNFDLKDLSEFPAVFKKNHLKGLNVTIPYKEEIIPYLDALSPEAKTIGAVNTITLKNNKLIGHNTDAFGFKNSLTPLLEKHHEKALILGTGGASKAIAYVLKTLGIAYTFVSRKNTSTNLSYTELSPLIIQAHNLIINCTPLGTFPNIETSPNIPYQHLNSQHLLYDLVYNPPLTTFLKQGKKQGCKTINGLKMLELQAEKAWKIWNS
ncbi:shikimate dehydrogenase [Mesonia hippocampi]|uniref:Shikimate dehydrogenase n=1 Tax=Mesonia hippocampi TaxID=1628250 RepID=A0A840ETJ7_9FLAO|nr:shikimate dehydrogenase [Mesonia hippocampi]MBB4119853.1 shikimate dehydrogenase [Mesonia hippocampi]